MKISACSKEAARKEFEQIAFNVYWRGSNWNQFKLALNFSPIYVEEV